MECSRRNEYRLILSLLLLTACFLVPPAMLGLKFTVFGLLMLFLALIIYMAIQSDISMEMSRKGLLLLLSVWLYYGYLIAQSLVLTGQAKLDYLKAVVSISIFIITFSIIFRDKVIKYNFFKCYIYVMAFFAFSNILTIICSFLFGTDGLLLYELPLFEDSYKLKIYFPLTVTYGRLHFLGTDIQRLSALYREPGIAQAFYIWAWVVCARYTSRKVVKTLLMLGALMTLSTTGFILFFITFTLSMFINHFSLRRVVFIIFFIPLCFFLYTSIPGLSLESKNAESYNARVGKLDESIDVFYDNPIFGVGASNAYIEGTSTSFLQQSYAVGIIGVMLFLLVPFVSLLFELRDYKLYLLSMFPIISTALVAQPIYDTSILYLLYLSSHAYDS